MKIKNIISIFLVTIFLSCEKQENVTPIETLNASTFESLNGSYTGNIYKWHRDYDSTHSFNVVETFDTIYNATSILEINVELNQIKFGGVIYKHHDDLNTNRDTIRGLFEYMTRPYNSIEIIKSLKFVRLYSSASAPTGPWAYTQTGMYYKD